MTTQTKTSIRQGRRRLYGAVWRDGSWHSTRSASPLSLEVEGRTRTTPTPTKGKPMQKKTATAKRTLTPEQQAEFRKRPSARAVTDIRARRNQKNRDAEMIERERITAQQDKRAAALVHMTLLAEALQSGAIR